MPLAPISPPIRFLALTAAVCLLALTGCGGHFTGLAASSPVANTVSRPIQGHVHGGVFPIQNATVRLMETQSNGYGGAAKALLPPVTTDPYGYFTFPNTAFTCDTGQFAYLTVSSGTTSNLASVILNNNVLQVGVIGSCATLSADFSAINVYLSEVSTVAAAAALANFTGIDSTDAAGGQQIVNISAPAANNAASPACGSGGNATCTAAGLAHGFANAYSLVDSVTFDGSFPSGQARSVVPTNAASYLPAQLLNALGNILQNCVDSVGGGVAGDGSYCGTLFTLATPPTPGAKPPTNTLQVALNMAKYPTNNVDTLYALQSRTPYFTPTLSTVPTALSVSIYYGAEADGGYVPFPIDLALDAADNVYILYSATSNSSATSGTGTANTFAAVLGLGPDGTQIFSGARNPALLYPTQIAVDSNGRVFVTDNDPYTLLNGGIYATAPNSTSGALFQIASVSNPSGVAVDRNNDLWVSVANTTGNSVLEYDHSIVQNATGSLLATTAFASSALGVPVTSITLDAHQNVWGVSEGANSYAVLVPNTGTTLAPLFNILTGGGFKQPLGNSGGYGVAVNAATQAFFPTNQQLNGASFSSSTLTAGVNGTLAIGSSGAPQRAAIDGAGNVFWADSETSGLLYEFAPGAANSATPNATPIFATGTLTSFLPCYPFPVGSGSACVTTTNSSPIFTPTNLRSLAIDSGGDVWYLAAAGVGTVVETLGLATPAWPQLSYGHPGCTPGLPTSAPSCP